MAWTNILDIPGLVFVVRYENDTGTSQPFDFVPTRPLIISGGNFVIDDGGDGQVDWMAVSIEITDDAGITLPADARMTLTSLTSPAWPQSTYGFGYGIESGFPFSVGSGFGAGTAANPYTGTATGSTDPAARFFNLNPGYPYNFTSGTLLIEIDADIPEPPVTEFWTEFVGSKETI